MITTKTASQSLGQEIRRRRLSVGWTLEQFAEACKVTPTHLGSIENGKLDPSASTVHAIAEALGCSVGDLFPELERTVSPAARASAATYEPSPAEVQAAVMPLLRLIARMAQTLPPAKDAVARRARGIRPTS